MPNHARIATVLFFALLWGCSGDTSDSGQGTVDAANLDGLTMPGDGNSQESGDRLLTGDDSKSEGENSKNKDATNGSGNEDVPPCDGCFGDPCDGNEDCDSGWCIQGPDGPMCTELCIEECPEGFECRQVLTPGGDPVFICVYTQIPYCRPCMKNGDCSDPLIGGQDNLCWSQNPAEGSFCATPCEKDANCPDGGSCQTVDNEGKSHKLCMPDTQTCECSQRHIDEQASTLCFKGNNFGTCEGLRTCTESGLSPCAANDATAELCNNIDEDCDGNTDEDFPEKGLPCDGPDAGICAAGLFVCEDDSLTCNEPPAPDKNCDDGDPCTLDMLVEEPGSCAYSCQHQIIPDCCGNGIIDGSETCDGACPETCNDNLKCTADIMSGSPATCDVKCNYEPLDDPGTDTDGDTLTDCEEETDEHPFTHPYIFNGLTAIIGESPAGFLELTSAQCNEFFGANFGQMYGNFYNSNQSQNIWAGWEYDGDTTNDYADSNAFDFEPNWSNSDNTGFWGSFQILFRGRIFLEKAGIHCFSVDTGAGGAGPGDIAGRRNSCGRVYVNANDATNPIAETGYGSAASPATGCVEVEAGSHDLDLAARHFESYFYSPKFHVRYCYGGMNACTPDQPLMTHQLQAHDSCAPNCDSSNCGADGCGFVCGHCSDTSTCGTDGLCAAGCTPFCGEKECGSDGCGGICGTCPADAACEIQGVCLGECQTQCDEWSCGPDGCGGSCGECNDGNYCNEGECSPICVADCAGKQCGSNGCGEQCGTCGDGEECNGAGQCTEICVANCAGKQCGGDGCGEQCGQCDSGDYCNGDDQCVSPGACVNASDQTFLSQYDAAAFTQLGTDCGLSCAFSSNATNCISSCYQDLGLSKDCADCYGAVGGCAKSNCAFKCFDPSSQGCLDCVKDSGCEDGLVECTGIE